MNEPQLDSNVTLDDDGPAVLEIDHGVVKKIRRGRQKVERPKPDPFKVMLRGEAERTGLGLRHLYDLLPPGTRKKWNNVDDVVDHCLNRPPEVELDPALARVIKDVYGEQPDRNPLIERRSSSAAAALNGLEINGTYGSNRHRTSFTDGRHGGLDKAFERMARAARPDAVSPAERDGKHGAESKPAAARRDMQP